MNWYQEDFKCLEDRLGTDFEKGLSQQEAAKRLEETGENRLASSEKKKNLVVRFLNQLNDFMVIILIVAAAVSFWVSYIQGEKDFADSIIILIIVFLNAALGLMQESKAEKAIEALKNMSAPMARVLRDGHIREIDAKQVVPGDVLVIETGDFICADGRLISSISLKAEESAITGESLAVEKSIEPIRAEHIPLGDRKNMVLSTSYITYGKGRAVVTETGMNTEVGKIAGLMMTEEDSQTPLQKRLGQTGKTLGTAAIIICLVIFLMGILRKAEPFEMFMTSISLAVAAIPEGLPAIVTIVLAIGMQRMSKKNTIIRKLPAVETLGSAQVICSDKTGTLTQNKMKVVKVGDYKAYLETEIEKRKLILMLATLCNDCYLNERKLVGEATETALAEAAQETGQNKDELEQSFPRVGEIPFSSERKLMTTIHKRKGKGYLIVTKGAPDVLVGKCTRCVDGKETSEFSQAKKNKTRALNTSMAEGALRVIAVAYSECDTMPRNQKPEDLERNLVFAGLVGMIDPPRPEARQAVYVCKMAGIKPVMITGDHALTAMAVGKDLGIFQEGDRYMTGEELEKTSQKELEGTIGQYSVFARVSPEHKVRIVKAFQSNGNVVAMTGDGVNDAPALKAADIGCAMGKNGTDVAKGAADMILTDDNFATIVEAVKEGRGIYSNIKKAVHFLLSSNIGEILTIFSAMLFGWSTPLLPIQLLWVNLVTDSLPAIALGLDPSDPEVMKHKPQKANQSLFADGLGERIALEGCMIGLLALIAFAIGHIYFDMEKGHIYGRTMAFAVLSISQLVHAFNMRSEGSIFKIHLFSNKFLVGAFIIGLILQTGVIMIPSLARLFLVAPLSLYQWGIVAALCLVPIVVVELEKLSWRLGK